MKRIAAYFKSPLLFITLLDGFADAAFGLILLVYISQLAAPYWLTILSIAGFLAGMSFGPLTGWVADRYSGRACWAGSLVFSALCVVAIGAFADPVVIVVASTLNGIASGLTNAAEFKLLPKAPGMTPSIASAYIVGIGSLCAIIAPPIGAFFATFNMRATIFCCAGLYFLASVISRVKVPPGRPEITIGRDSLKDVFLGFSALKSSRAIAVFLPVLTLVVVATSMEGISGVFYLQSITSTFGFSAILAMWAVGTFIASVCYGRGIWRPNIVV